MSFKAEFIQKVKEIHEKALDNNLAEQKARSEAENYIKRYFDEFQTELRKFVANGILSIDTNKYGKNEEFFKMELGRNSLAFEDGKEEKIIKVYINKEEYDRLSFNSEKMASHKFQTELSEELLDVYLKESFGATLGM